MMKAASLMHHVAAIICPLNDAWRTGTGDGLANRGLGAGCSKPGAAPPGILAPEELVNSVKLDL